MSRKVVVIGAGPAGYVCAIRLAQLGQEVTVVEKGELGGTCLNVGCIPSKALIAAGALMEKVKKASAMGITVADMALDVDKLVEWKQGVVTRLTGGIGGLFKQHGITHVIGSGSLESKTRVKVVADDGSESFLDCDDIVLATGSIPTEIPGFAFDEDKVWSSTGALAPSRIPGHIVVIGGGYIGLELGMMYHKLGSQVTVLEATPGALPGQDADCVKLIERSLKKSKIKLHTNVFAKGWEETADGLSVQFEGKDGERQSVTCDQILVTVGRRPYSEGLNLDKAGITVDKAGHVATDNKMRTSVPNIYSVGDLAGQPMLAHKGSKEGLVAAAVIAGLPEEYDVLAVPAVIFTSPEMAAVGLDEAQAKEAGYEVAVGKFPFAASGRAMSLMETDGFVKIVADAKTDLVLGVQMVGPEVTELIAEAALAIEMGATTEDIARTIHAHPTLPEVMMEAAEAVHNMAIHIYQPPKG
ncbi:MAG: dihydrolipoyl dehydrogenase [Planctomycetota bacterium]|nr:dihydrolipoyl dehydrogenase [Planctomycetota bacterium]